jgi:hypothetical protein
VAWPFIAGWFAVALACGVYVVGSRFWVRLAFTAVVGVALALLLRAAVTHRTIPVAFIAVAYGFIALSTFGWRALALALPRLARRRRGPVSGADASP